jgi:hypothetical protein
MNFERVRNNDSEASRKLVIGQVRIGRAESSDLDNDIGNRTSLNRKEPSLQILEFRIGSD